MVDKTDSAALRLRFQAANERLQAPAAGVGVESQARRVEDTGDEVAAEEVPVGAVEGGEDGDVVAVEDLGGGGGGRAVGEGGAVVDEGLVGEGVAGDEDDGAGAEVEGEDGAVVGVEIVNQGEES